MTQLATKQDAASRPYKTFRILYADDLHDLRELAKLSLARDGHTVDGVPDGAPALEKVMADPTAYDIVITDHHMVHMNGLELVTRLRSIAFPGRIVVFSSELSSEVNEAYKGLNVDAILFKPVLPNVLRELLRSF
ncbi:MAG TPA: response regulator [Candidatus Didemnitutus sp.]|nr:response regulator [Candidatus Didemnitutus sp.]